jgi:hypothetical protein
MNEAPSTEPTTKETYRQDAERPLTAQDFYRAIEALRFAVTCDGYHLQASNDPESKKPFHSPSDIASAIDIFEKLSARGKFHFRVFEGPHNPEEMYRPDSAAATLQKINYLAEGSEMYLTGLIAFLATLIHGSPVLKKHPKTKDMKNALQNFKIFFEIDQQFDHFFTPFVDLALYARDQIKGLKAT